MCLRQLISFFSAILLGLSSVGAYIPEHLGGESTQVQTSNLQMEGAILLNEDGTPRCRIGKLPSEDLGIGLDNLDALEECGESDELHARTIFESEEISLGMAAPPQFVKGAEFLWETGRVAAPVLAIGFFAGCLPPKLDDLFSVSMKKPTPKGIGIVVMGFIVLVTGAFGVGAIIHQVAANEAMGIALGLSGAFTASTGFIVCTDG